MAGVTDAVFRRLCREQGCGLTYTEMVSAKGLRYAGKNSLQLITQDEGSPSACQIFGSDPDIMAGQAASEALLGFDIIDINMGCPARKITANGEGCSLMKTPELAERIIKSCVKVNAKPITVKFRAGWDETSINAVEFARMAEGSGAAAVTVHGRTASMGYSGRADWGIIERVKNAVKIPVIGNGDITRPEQAFDMLRATGCDAVMIARGAQGNPWIFAQIIDIASGRQPPSVTLRQRCETAARHLRELAALKGERTAVLQMRKHAAWYLKGVPQTAHLRQRINAAGSVEEFTAIFDGLLASKD